MKWILSLFHANWLAGLFKWIREVIEEADRPLSLLITIVLPFVAPIIPALVTAGNLHKYMGYTQEMATLAAIAFALVGYVSMIAGIGAIMNFVEQERNQRVWLPVFITVGSYLVYVLALVMINIVLEVENGVAGTKVFVTALMTLGLEIPASLLNGTRINSRDKNEKDERKRQEDRLDRKERYRLRMESSKKLSSGEESFQESSNDNRKVSGKMESWRKVRQKLSAEQMERLAQLSPDEMKVYASQTGFTYKTISNWRNNARNELGIRND
jgi:hypothetical protein